MNHPDTFSIYLSVDISLILSRSVEHWELIDKNKYYDYDNNDSLVIHPSLEKFIFLMFKTSVLCTQTYD